MDKTEYQQCYDEGFAVFMSGEYPVYNPYVADDQEPQWQAWYDGFEAARVVRDNRKLG